MLIDPDGNPILVDQHRWDGETENRTCKVKPKPLQPICKKLVVCAEFYEAHLLGLVYDQG
jgi:hypothetical protein